jgi:hypothetical protein
MLLDRFQDIFFKYGFNRHENWGKPEAYSLNSRYISASFYLSENISNINSNVILFDAKLG